MEVIAASKNQLMESAGGEVYLVHLNLSTKYYPDAFEFSNVFAKESDAVAYVIKEVEEKQSSNTKLVSAIKNSSDLSDVEQVMKKFFKSDVEDVFAFSKMTIDSDDYPDDDFFYEY
jgi:hypothetical protein